MLIQFKQEPNIGTVIQLDGQSFEMIGEQPYQRKDGTMTRLLDWVSHCPDCGAQFEVSTATMSATFARRCVEHRKAGRPVKGKRGRKVNVAIIEA